MVRVAGKPLLSHIVDACNATGIKKITVVRGYCKEAVDLPSLSFVDNDEFEHSGELMSLLKGLQSLDRSQDLIVCYGDVLFHKYIAQILSETEDDLAVAIDTNWRESANRDRHADYATCSLPSSRRSFSARITLKRISTDIAEEQVHGEWMGFLKISAEAMDGVIQQAKALLAEESNRQAKLPDLLNHMMASGHEVRALYTTGHWLDIDSLDDVVQAGNF
jgi:phosphoenolpyruvate phosphomutase